MPLTVSIDPNALSNNADAADVDPVTDMVGDPVDPVDPVDPGAPEAPTLTMATAGDMEVALTWTAATTGDAADSFEYRVDGGTAMAIAGSTATTTTHNGNKSDQWNDIRL